MISHIVELIVPGAKAEQFYDFMINPDSRRYSEWWPEEHLEFRIIKSNNENHLGDEVYYDEYLGEKRRLAFYAVVTKANRHNHSEPLYSENTAFGCHTYPEFVIVWQMKKAGLWLPAFLSLEMSDSPEGIQIKHELQLGYRGFGEIFDPFISLYFTESFQSAIEDHCRIEWPRLAEYLNRP